MEQFANWDFSGGMSERVRLELDAQAAAREEKSVRNLRKTVTTLNKTLEDWKKHSDS